MYNVLIVGVGGQGSLLASRVLGSLFMHGGHDIKVSEVHGMSQRGGSVVTYVRAGERVASPLVPVGEADIIIAFEQLEALRWSHYLKPGGTIVYSTQRILPMPVITGAETYPESIQEKLCAGGARCAAVDAHELAMKAGNVKAANMVLLGAASKVIGFTENEWKDALREVVPARLLEINITAFSYGRDVG